MIAEGRRRYAAVPNLELKVGDVQALAFEDRAFDRVIASQLMVHVPDDRGLRVMGSGEPAP